MADPVDIALTSFQVAKALGVSRKSVAIWFDMGKLLGFRTDGRGGKGHRRYPLDKLREFARARKMPLDLSGIPGAIQQPQPLAPKVAPPTVDLAALEVAVKSMGAAVKSIGASLELVTEEIEKLKQAQ